MTTIEIPLSKKKNLLMLAGSLTFVVIGFFFVAQPENFVSPGHNYSTLIRFAGMLGIAFFGACAMYGVIKFFDRKPGLIIDENGITDNTNGSSIGLIKWGDISSIQSQQVRAARFLLVFIKDPDKYLRSTTGLKRQLLKANMKVYGTPLSIVSNSIKCRFEDLEILLNSNLLKFKDKNL